MSKEIDLSLDGILDYRWELREIGDGKIKLCYNSMKGIPTVEETKKAIRMVFEEKGLDSLYISGTKGDINISSKSEEIDTKIKETSEGKTTKTSEYDYMQYPFGAEENLINREIE